jgi:hypothetical protein
VRSQTHIHMYRKKSLAYRWVPQGFEAILMLFLNPSVAPNDVTLLMGPELIVLQIPNTDSCVDNHHSSVCAENSELCCSCQRKNKLCSCWPGVLQRAGSLSVCLCVCLSVSTGLCAVAGNCLKYLQKYKESCFVLKILGYKVSVL